MKKHLTERVGDVDGAENPHSADMRISITLAVPFAGLLIGSMARAQAPVADASDASDAPIQLVGIGVSKRVVVEDATGIDAARRAFLDGWERKAAKGLQTASSQLRQEALTLDERSRGPMLEVAARLEATGIDVELGTLDDATFDRRLSSMMRSLAGHHLALARAAMNRSEATVAGEHLSKALDAFERALRWRGAHVDSTTETALHEARDIAADLQAALVLASDVKKALASIEDELDREIASAHP